MLYKLRISLLAALLLVLASCYSNTHSVITWNDETSIFYRSGQMRDWQLENAIQEYKLEKVINLRGENKKEDWYKKEVKICKKNGVTHQDIKLSAWGAPKKEELIKLVNAIIDSYQKNKNTIVHCYGGADRASFASAVARILIKKDSVKKALTEYKLIYGHICRGYCEPEEILKAYQPFEKKMSFKGWVEKYYKREHFKKR